MSSKPQKSKIVAIFLSYNAERTLERFYKKFPHNLVEDAILFDDASTDRTVEIARKLGISVHRNKENLGYGGNLKGAIRQVLDQGADIIIDIHPDGEYSCSSIPEAISRIDGGAHLVLGNRFRTENGPLRSGMFIWKYPVIVILNWLNGCIFGSRNIDYHSGFRAYSRNLFEQVNYEKNSNSFLFSFELIAQCLYHQLVLDDVPVDTIYTGKKRGANFRHVARYTIGTFWTLVTFLLARSGLKCNIYR